MVPQLLKKKIIFRIYLFHCWRSGEQDVRAVCQLSGREITNSFLSGVREPGLLLSKGNYFTKKVLSLQGEKKLNSTEFASHSFASVL